MALILGPLFRLRYLNGFHFGPLRVRYFGMYAQLIALSSAISYAASTIAARLGMTTSTPITMTCISLVIHTVSLSAIVFLTERMQVIAREKFTTKCTKDTK